MVELNVLVGTVGFLILAGISGYGTYHAVKKIIELDEEDKRCESKATGQM